MCSLSAGTESHWSVNIKGYLDLLNSSSKASPQLLTLIFHVVWECPAVSSTLTLVKLERQKRELDMGHRSKFGCVYPSWIERFHVFPWLNGECPLSPSCFCLSQLPILPSLEPRKSSGRQQGRENRSGKGRWQLIWILSELLGMSWAALCHPLQFLLAPEWVSLES